MPVGDGGFVGQGVGRFSGTMSTVEKGGGGGHHLLPRYAEWVSGTYLNMGTQLVPLFPLDTYAGFKRNHWVQDATRSRDMPQCINFCCRFSATANGDNGTAVNFSKRNVLGGGHK